MRGGRSALLYTNMHTSRHPLNAAFPCVLYSVIMPVIGLLVDTNETNEETCLFKNENRRSVHSVGTFCIQPYANNFIVIGRLINRMD